MRASERRSKVKALLSLGKSPAEIAIEVGVALSTVYRIKNSEGSRKGNRAAYRTITAKVTPFELAGVDRHVRAGVASSRSSVLRKLVRVSGGFYEATPDEDAFLRGAMAHLARLGGNFNQVANALSVSVKKTGKASPSAKQIERIREANDEVEKIKRVIEAMVQSKQLTSKALNDHIQRDAFSELEDE